MLPAGGGQVSTLQKDGKSGETERGEAVSQQACLQQKKILWVREMKVC